MQPATDAQVATASAAAANAQAAEADAASVDIQLQAVEATLFQLKLARLLLSAEDTLDVLPLPPGFARLGGGT